MPFHGRRAVGPVRAATREVQLWADAHRLAWKQAAPAATATPFPLPSARSTWDARWCGNPAGCVTLTGEGAAAMSAVGAGSNAGMHAAGRQQPAPEDEAFRCGR